MAAPCQESAVRLLVHTGQARGLCPGLTGVMLLPSACSAPSLSSLEEVTGKERGAANETFAR